MPIDLKTVENLAPDQASLKAAAGLAKPARWSDIGISQDGVLIWGACAGSGANPYRVVADLRDLGNKCTCPSRKFPCKHGLALLWLKADSVAPFPPGLPPDWVSDWLGRRRGSRSKAADDAATAETKDVQSAREATPDAPLDPNAAARREAAAAKRVDEAERSILEALDALEYWIGDQLRIGLAAFINDATARCRRIAARLVDGKATALAGRIDELPARLLALPAGDRPRGAVVELGKLIVLARAFRAAPRERAIRRAVATFETREALLSDAAAIHVSARWEVLAEQVQTRRDGLVSQTTWLLNLGSHEPRFAMLLDFFPASAGKRGSFFVPGEQFSGDMLFYPSARPLRAVLMNRARESGEARSIWPAPENDVATMLSEPLLTEPWLLDLPVLLPAGRIALDSSGRAWWRASNQEATLPLTGEIEGVLRGTELAQTAAIWSGNQLAILAARTPWGRIGAHG